MIHVQRNTCVGSCQWLPTLVFSIKSKLEYKHPPMSRTESYQIYRYNSFIFVDRWHVQTTELKNVLVMYLCNEKEKVSSRFDPDKS